MNVCTLYRVARVVVCRFTGAYRTSVVPTYLNLGVVAPCRPNKPNKR